MIAVLVDDQQLVRDGLVALLEGADFHILGQAARMDEGVELAVALKPDVVLLNIAMPGTGRARHDPEDQAGAPALRHRRLL